VATLTEPTLRVRGLCIRHRARDLVRDVSFDVAAGERVGLIGESGSGKSLTALAIMGLLGRGLSATGQVLLGGEDLSAAPERRCCTLRGAKISMIFQEPMTALTPTMRIGRQVSEAIQIHRKLSKADAREASRNLLRRVELQDVERYERRYPHELSGGQRQRVMLAMAIACNPQLIVADEPTTALDVTVQKRMLELMRRLVTEEGAALLLITHDIAVVSEMCDRTMTMYGGRLVEIADTASMLTAPRHPYTAALLAASRAVTLDSDVPAGDLPTIPGSVPASGVFPPGCPYRNRCGNASEKCQVMPSLEPLGDHLMACWHPVPLPPSTAGTGAPSTTPPVVEGAGAASRLPEGPNE
jgi:oligopeptide/dipeptide ABC transporter ATP-binding protein